MKILLVVAVLSTLLSVTYAVGGGKFSVFIQIPSASEERLKKLIS